MRPVVLDFDGSVGEMPGELRVGLAELQEATRLSCTLRNLRSLEPRLPDLPAPERAVVFTGSGDFHHLTLPLIERLARHAQFDVLVFDNHPDNMRYPWGVHCGSWIMHVARLRQVRRVDVVGITSADVSARHAWANYWLPLFRRKLTYWCVGVDTRWARLVGLANNVLSFSSPERMLQGFAMQQRPGGVPVYISIDKDVMSSRVVRSNWDQGVLTEEQLYALIRCIHAPVIAADITGDVSQYQYTTRWKRLLNWMEPQPAVESTELRAWQAQHHALNLRLVEYLADNVNMAPRSPRSGVS